MVWHFHIDLYHFHKDSSKLNFLTSLKVEHIRLIFVQFELLNYQPQFFELMFILLLLNLPYLFGFFFIVFLDHSLVRSALPNCVWLVVKGVDTTSVRSQMAASV